jgi:DNA topoisomerase-1
MRETSRFPELPQGYRRRAMARLRRANPETSGYTRRRRGRGFEYRDEHDGLIRDREVLERIRGLAIPPAWTDVWIAPDELAHIQALGTDVAGRRQYLYHPLWREQRDAQKFEHVLEFAAALPRLRETVASHLALPDLRRERVLACAVRLLDLGFFRIGSEPYAEDNGSFGLATLRRDHVRLERGDVIVFDYVAKGGKRRLQRLVDPDAHAVLAALGRRRAGGELLAYRERRRWHDVRSSDINDYIKQHACADCSAKDFRTWHGTVLASVSLALLGARANGSERARKSVESHAVREVAHYLGNTPAVCRASYIDPRVFDRYREGRTLDLDLEQVAEPVEDLLPRAEQAVRALLNGKL